MVSLLTLINLKRVPAEILFKNEYKHLGLRPSGRLPFNAFGARTQRNTQMRIVVIYTDAAHIAQSTNKHIEIQITTTLCGQTD